MWFSCFTYIKSRHCVCILMAAARWSNTSSAKRTLWDSRSSYNQKLINGLLIHHVYNHVPPSHYTVCTWIWLTLICTHTWIWLSLLCTRTWIWLSLLCTCTWIWLTLICTWISYVHVHDYPSCVHVHVPHISYTCMYVYYEYDYPSYSVGIV